MYFVILVHQQKENNMNDINNMTPMEQLIDVMTKDIKEWIEEILYVEHNYYVLVLSTGELIHFTKE